ncbi:DNA primase [Patescibacteria group bacterium]|nr:DNA primase [Patescibacteria group bacterium]
MISSPIEEIKNRLDIVEVIQNYIKLQKAGVNFRSICPFHSEKAPSFFVSPARQIWHCFGCNAGGNLFNFVMQIEGVEFGDALRILAQKAGVELKRQDPKLETERQRLYEVIELACQFFERQLEGGKTAGAVKKYLLERGTTEDSIKKWRLGYAPDSWQGLSDFLANRGYQKEEIIKAGLAIKKGGNNFRVDPRSYSPRSAGEAGSHESVSTSYDRFRGRIIFPIFDLSSQVIGFGGRILEDTQDEAKYVNSPSTLLYDKSSVLYGLDKARVEIRKKDFCILVEGYLDVILSHQVGFENVIATSGTALTTSQLKILKRYSENMLTAFDMDIAGDTATRRGIDLAQAGGFNVKVITMKKGSDPADIISENSESWGKLVSTAKSILEFYFETAFSRFNKQNPEGKKEISKLLLPIIKIIPNKIEQSYWIQELSKKLEIKEEIIAEELKKTKLDKRESEVEEEKIVLQPKSRKELLEERLAFLIIKYPQMIKVINSEILPNFSQKIQEVFAHFSNKQELSSDGAEFMNYLFLKAEIEKIEEKDAEIEIELCVKETCSLVAKDKLESLTKEIKKAEEAKDFGKTNILIKEFNQLSQQFNSD